MTITEALAKLKTIDKRLEKKREFIRNYVARQKKFAEPSDFATKGGTQAVLGSELQSYDDLITERELIRLSIAEANAKEKLTLNGETRSISGWLTWRRECAPLLGQLYSELVSTIRQHEGDAKRHGAATVDTDSDSLDPNDVVFFIDRPQLAAKIEALEGVLGDLDGALSLKNATITIQL